LPLPEISSSLPQLLPQILLLCKLCDLDLVDLCVVELAILFGSKVGFLVVLRSEGLILVEVESMFAFLCEESLVLVLAETFLPESIPTD